MSDEQDIAEQVRGIREAVSGYRAAQIYITFARLGIGDALADGPLSLDDLAREIDADPGALDRYVQVALAFGLLRELHQGQLELTDVGRAAFTPEGVHSIANLLKLEGAFYERWGRLAQAVRTGERPPENRAQEDDPGWVRMFTLALFDNARQTAPAVARAIDQVLPESEQRPLRVVDVGGGNGAYSLALAERRRNLDVIVFDLPPVIEVTRELVAVSPYADRVRAVAGDFHSDPIGDGYDAVLLFGVLHGETPENAERLLRTVCDALAPDGLLLIRSQGQARGTSEPGEREMFDLHMLLSTEGGEVRRQRDTSDLVRGQGFAELEPVDIPEPASGRLLMFQAPS